MDANSTFSNLGIDAKILASLNKFNITVPTPIQHKAIPVGLEGKDIIGIAQTGTGKTIAFAVPIIQRLSKMQGNALIILPTRELALQVEEAFKKFSHLFALRITVLIGGQSMGQQMRDLRRSPRVVVGTPGRIIDHLKRRTLDLRSTKILVLDEADRMLDMGFAPQINEILRSVPRERQTMLFSATMPDNIVKIATTHMKMPVRVEIARPGTAAEGVEQEIFIVDANKKNRLLEAVLTEYKGSILVFSRTKFGAKRICALVKHIGFTASEIHSNKSLAQRREALEGFQTGKYRILVATDIAARGIDVVGIEVVINYDMPEAAEDYVHRIGRTGRAGQVGRAITFATPDQRHKIRHIESLVRTALRISKLPLLPPDRVPPPMPRSKYVPRRPSFGGGGQRSSGHRRGGNGSGGGGHSSYTRRSR